MRYINLIFIFLLGSSSIVFAANNGNGNGGGSNPNEAIAALEGVVADLQALVAANSEAIGSNTTEIGTNTENIADLIPNSSVTGSTYKMALIASSMAVLNFLPHNNDGLLRRNSTITFFSNGSGTWVIDECVQYVRNDPENDDTDGNTVFSTMEALGCDAGYLGTLGDFDYIQNGNTVEIILLADETGGVTTLTVGNGGNILINADGEFLDDAIISPALPPHFTFDASAQIFQVGIRVN